jgi:DNA processing protein
VLAHGLDTIYPARHRSTAAQMCHHGGLLTEYLSGTKMQRGFFVRRNRIVAGMSMATVVVESAEKGGALITAELAGEYDREVFAFPGRIYDPYSEGCNKLISRNEAHLIRSCSDFMRLMGWEEPASQKAEEQLELFPELSVEEQAIVDCLKSVDSMQINKISIETNLTYSQVSSALFELEMKGLVAVLGGARYRLLRG